MLYLPNLFVAIKDVPCSGHRMSNSVELQKFISGILQINPLKGGLKGGTSAYSIVHP